MEVCWERLQNTRQWRRYTAVRLMRSLSVQCTVTFTQTFVSSSTSSSSYPYHIAINSTPPLLFLSHLPNVLPSLSPSWCNHTCWSLHPIQSIPLLPSSFFSHLHNACIFVNLSSTFLMYSYLFVTRPSPQHTHTHTHTESNWSQQVLPPKIGSRFFLSKGQSSYSGWGRVHAAMCRTVWCYHHWFLWSHWWGHCRTSIIP